MTDAGNAAAAHTGADSATTRVFKGSLHRVTQDRRRVFTQRAPKKRPAPALPVAKLLALAHRMQEQLDRGIARDLAELAAMHGLTRARISQILDLTLLAPDIQEAVLFAEGGERAITERRLREVVRERGWGGGAAGEVVVRGA